MPATIANDDGVNTEIRKKFTLTNKKLIEASTNYNEEEAAQEHVKQMAAYKKSRGIDPDTKIFKVLGRYPTLRTELERRGMVENDWPEDEENKEKFVSQAFDFLYAKKVLDIIRIPLAPNQQVNAIIGQNALTTKVGLTHNMKNLVWIYNMDIGRTFPQSFDISDANSEEFKDFREDFKFTYVISFLN